MNYKYKGGGCKSNFRDSSKESSIKLVFRERRTFYCMKSRKNIEAPPLEFHLHFICILKGNKIHGRVREKLQKNES